METSADSTSGSSGPKKAALTGHYEGTSMWLSWLNAAGRALTFTPPVPFVNQQILQADGTPIEGHAEGELGDDGGNQNRRPR